MKSVSSFSSSFFLLLSTPLRAFAVDSLDWVHQDYVIQQAQHYSIGRTSIHDAMEAIIQGANKYSRLGPWSSYYIWFLLPVSTRPV
jgi:hypothetical protein